MKLRMHAVVHEVAVECIGCGRFSYDGFAFATSLRPVFLPESFKALLGP